MKAKKVKSLNEKEKAQAILARNKKQKEQEPNPQDQIAFERFRFFNSDKYERKVKLLFYIIFIY